MAINWKTRTSVFQLLAAVYAEMGEEAFRGRYASIARYFGPNATYDSIKSFFAKEVVKAADQLKAADPDHHGSGRGIPSRQSAGSSQPLLLGLAEDDDDDDDNDDDDDYEDEDEDVVIVTRREFDAHCGDGLDQPAKRPRMATRSQVSSPKDEIPTCTTMSDIPTAGLAHDTKSDTSPESVQESVQQTRRASALTRPAIHLEVGEPSTAQSPRFVAAPESGGSGSNKRPYNTLNEPIDVRHSRSSSLNLSTSSLPKSFGYVTNLGQHRCALCLRELESEEAMSLHEALSKDHLRNLKIPIKVSQGRDKLAKVTAIPIPGLREPTPEPPLPPRFDDPADIEIPSRPDHTPSGCPCSFCAPDQNPIYQMGEHDRQNAASHDAQARVSTIPSPNREHASAQYRQSVQPSDKGKGCTGSCRLTRETSHSRLTTHDRFPFQPVRGTTTPNLPPAGAYRLHGVQALSPLSQTEVFDVLRATEIVQQMMVQCNRAARNVAREGGMLPAEDVSAFASHLNHTMLEPLARRLARAPSPGDLPDDAGPQ